MIPQAFIESTENGAVLYCGGEWTLAGVRVSPLPTRAILARYPQAIVIDVNKISRLDTIGALYLQRLVQELKVLGKEISVQGCNPEQTAITELVADKIGQIQGISKPVPRINLLVILGRWATGKWNNSVQFFAFFGEIILNLYKTRAGNLWKSALRIVEAAGCEALPIVGLMSFLVGVVLSYQLGVQLKLYGADIYVVDSTGIAILREFAPLMTAVIIAGRTSTAFAALIGTMKVNDELDALTTMGISPIQRLVIPRILGLLVALPLLVVWSSIFSIFGSMIMAKSQLDIGYLTFLQRFQVVVALKHYWLGLIKTPVFAAIIAIVGCFQGFQAGITADSVGLKTTAAAVQAIFLIIIADAFFSVVYSWQGL